MFNLSYLNENNIYDESLIIKTVTKGISRRQKKNKVLPQVPICV